MLFLYRWVVDGCMLEVVLGIIAVLLILITAIHAHIVRINMMKVIGQEGELVKENLNHLAGAIISLSELLDDADQVIENISQVPTVGEMIQQALVGFMTQKFQQTLPDPVISPMKEVISEVVNPEEHGTKKKVT